MHVHTEADVLRLQEGLRDVVALSAMPAVWIGSEPLAVAGGLADALVGLLQLDFAFVRLSDPGGAGAVEATRGSAWTSFPGWLEGRLATSAPFPRKEVVPDIGDDSPRRRGLAMPVGVNGEAGVVAAASERRDFPTPMDQLLLSLAANQAAAAFQGARLIHERKRAEEALRNARDELEVKVAERTAELHVANDELSALRRVATLVAEGAQPQDLFAVVAEEVCRVVEVPLVSVVRYEPDRTATECASFSTEGPALFPVGKRWALEGTNVLRLVRESSEPARIDNHSQLEGEIADAVRRSGIRSTVGVPVVVAGRVWGAMVVSTTEDEPLSLGTEARLAEFTELLATAVENAESREALERVSEEQAALRRVATLVAQDVEPVETFSAVSEEVGRLFGSKLAAVGRFDADGPAHIVVGVAQSTEGVAVGSRWELDDAMATAEVYRTGRSARVDAVDWSAVSTPIAEAARRLGTVSTVASPIVVEGRLWGAMTVSANDPLPIDADERLEKFAELVATAIANADARAEVERLAEEQAALRRVAMLVAGGAAPAAVFDAVAAEMERLLGADGVTLSRYEPEEEVTVVAHRGSNASQVPPGTRVGHQGENVTSLVRRSERPARLEHYEGAHGAIADLARSLGVRASVAAPIVVDGRLWGVTIANWRGEESPPADTEERMAQFAELLDTAIANADSRDQLTASRARLVTAADDARRRVVRDLHDGAQQRLVHTIVTLKLAQRAFREQDGKAEALIGEALEHAEHGNAELRELAHGILPAVLTRGGLRAALGAFVARLDLPIEVDLPVERLPAEAEASAYFVVAEALTNVVKHSHARRAEVSAHVEGEMLHIEIRDDGIGGADPGGHGLVGMGDRVSALGGRLELESPASGGTLVAATLPLSAG